MVIAACVWIGSAGPLPSRAQAADTVQDQVLALDATLAQLAWTYQRLVEIAPQIDQAALDAADASDARIRAETELRRLGNAQQAAGLSIVEAQVAVDAMARAAFVGDERGPVEELLVADDPVAASARRTLSKAVVEARARSVVQLADARAAVDARTLAAADALAEAVSAEEAAIIEVQRLRDEQALLQLAVGVLTADVDRLRSELLSGNATALVPGTDVPVIALAAYQRAATYAGRLYKGCGIGWFHIAGIGKQESNHGRFAGSNPNRSGDVLPPIRGIPLDGTRSLAIADTDAGQMDGDPVWDRAVGPTQFIPSTWRGYAARFDLDGDGDGSEDPDNLFDAARATGIYLCRNAGGPLSDIAALRRAVLAYNPSASYEAAVLVHMERYGGDLVPDLEGIGDPSPPGVVAPEPPPPTTAPVAPGEEVVPEGPASVGEDPDATSTTTSTTVPGDTPDTTASEPAPTDPTTTTSVSP